MPKVLEYIGNGDFLPEIPARDLDESEIAEVAIKFLLSTKLYKLCELLAEQKGKQKLKAPEGEGVKESE